MGRVRLLEGPAAWAAGLALALAAGGCAIEAERSILLPEALPPAAAPAPEGAPAAPPPAAPSAEARRADELSRRGERAYRQESYRLAERHFRAALELAPEKLHALTGLAWTLYDAKRPDEAYPYFKKAHRLFPNDGSARRGLAYLLYRYGRRWDARVLLGTLDKERWPELANIDDELRGRRARGLSLPRLPEASKKSPRTPKEEEEAPPAVPPERRARAAPPPAPEAPPRLMPPGAQPPSFRNMILIPGGTFVMGETRANGRNGRRTKRNGGRRVRVETFRLDKFEVTNAHYAAFVEATRSPEPPFWRRPHFAGPHLPVVGVTWHEARAYCAWAGKRLPSEREWEFAARGGKMARSYPWGERFRGLGAVYGLRPDTGGPKAVGRHPAGASLHGVEDLAGNVWEWVEDPYRPRPGGGAPLSKGGTAFRTLRGGSWVNGRWAMAATSRTGDLPGRRLPVYGFRCAADAP